MRSGTPQPLTIAILAALLATAAHAQPTAERDARSGQEVVERVCAACHAGGTDGAPRIGDNKAWHKRMSQGLGGLTRVALDGIRRMPAHGGSPGLSDLEIQRAITYMVNRSGGSWKEPIDKSAPPTQRSAAQIVATQCAKCHQTGVGGAPRIGDQAAWVPRLKPGFEAVVRSATSGHGAMPARGGMADLTDPELRSAITYMFNPPASPSK